MSELWTLNRNEYRGLIQRVAPGTHEAVVNMLLRHNVPRDSVIDLASGSGALTARLRDHGFKEIVGVDMDVEQYKLDGPKPLVLNLNRPFAKQVGRKFKLVTAVEIIEHLDDPRAFLREARKALDPDGYLLVSAPNISSWWGRLKFLRRGELDYFDVIQYRFNRHVSPISHNHMQWMLREVGFKLIDNCAAGTFFGPLRKLVWAPVALPMRLLFGKGVLGDVNIYLARPAEPDPWCFGDPIGFLRKPAAEDNSGATDANPGVAA